MSAFPLTKIAMGTVNRWDFTLVDIIAQVFYHLSLELKFVHPQQNWPFFGTGRV